MTTFTKEQLIEAVKTRMEANKYLLAHLSPESRVLLEVALNLKVDEIALAAITTEPLMWVNEDALPANYPYNELYPFSKVDITRMFPVYAPQPAPVVDVSFDEWLTSTGRKPVAWVREVMEESYNACHAAMLTSRLLWEQQ